MLHENRFVYKVGVLKCRKEKRVAGSLLGARRESDRATRGWAGDPLEDRAGGTEGHRESGKTF